jgi:hypothetical protein
VWLTKVLLTKVLFTKVLFTTVLFTTLFATVFVHRQRGGSLPVGQVQPSAVRGTASSNVAEIDDPRFLTESSHKILVKLSRPKRRSCQERAKFCRGWRPAAVPQETFRYHTDRASFPS